jgi:hypothetical protein
MDTRKILAAVVAATVGAVMLALVVPLAAGVPSLLPPEFVPWASRTWKTGYEYHDYIPAELAACAIVCFCLGLYFWVAEPRVYRPRYRPKRRW